MIQYFVLSLVSVLAGRGWLRLFGLAVAPKGEALLAPAMVMSLWAITTGATISLGMPVSSIWQVLFAVTILLAIIGATGKTIGAELRSSGWLLVAMAIPPLFLYPYIQHGVFSYVGPTAWDGWSYVAVGQYLWEYPLGTEGGLQPLYQYSAHLAGTRFVGSGFLGLLSPLALQPGEPYLSRGLFILWSFFVSGCSLLYFAQRYTRDKRTCILYLVMSLCSGWLIMAVFANNYDNLVFWALMPAFAAYCRGADITRRLSFIPAGILMAGMLYTYPEMSIFALFIGLIIFWARPDSALRKLGFMAAVVLLASIMLAPYFKTLLAFFQGQLASAKAGGAARPGEGMFPELLQWTVAFPAYWGIWVRSMDGRSFADVVRLFLAYAGAVVCTAAFFAGSRSMLSRREGAVPLASGVLAAVSLYFIIRQHYDYGAYKVILLNWWLVAFLCVAGFEHALEVVGRNWGEKLKLRLWLALFLGLALVGWGKVGAMDRTVQTKEMKDFQVIQTAIKQSENSSVILNVSDDAANAWAVYFLRSHPLKIVNYKHYMAQPHVLPFMERAKKADDASVKYVISDAGQCVNNGALRTLAPNAGRYCIMEVLQPGGFDVIRVSNPNGQESVDGMPFYWLGRGETVITVVSSTDRAAALDMELTLGPSLPESAPRRLKIVVEGRAPQEYLVAKNEKIFYPIHLRAGENKIVLTTPDKPSIARQPNGDDRPLILHLRNIQVRTVY